MEAKNNPNQIIAKTVLVVPLDWGLGHTSRCIPVIKSLIQKGFKVILAGNKKQAALLKSELPDLSFHFLEGYNIRYGRSRLLTILKIILQFPNILSSIRKEREWLKMMVSNHPIGLVISDNRFGLSHPDVRCIFISHQLTIRSSLGKMADLLARKINYRYIRHFTECWIPDFANQPDLAGQLSHPPVFPGIPCRYIGPLTRFEHFDTKEEEGRVLIILSGPEPQRTAFEKSIIGQIKDYKGKKVVIRGLPDETAFRHDPGTDTDYYNHLPTTEMTEEIQKAAYIISRSGYSTIMDLYQFRKKIILVPTPGQAEQEYLAAYLAAGSLALVEKQKNFALLSVLKKAASFPYRFIERETGSGLEEAITGL